MSDFNNVMGSCQFRHFEECLNKERPAHSLCDELECPMVSIGAERTELLERALANLDVSQLRLLSAMLSCAWPATDKRARVWNERVSGLITKEIEKRKCI